MARRLDRTLSRAGLSVVALMTEVDELKAFSATTHPQVLVMVGGDRADVVARLQVVTENLPGTRIVLTVDDRRAEAVREAVQAGADGVVMESRLSAAVAAVVRAVALGYAVVPLNDRSVLARQRLSAREREILGLTADGLSKAQIGERLHLAESTVKSHLSSAFLKLGVRSRAELIAVFSERRDARASRTTQHGDNA